MEQERQLRKLIGLRDWMMAVLAFPVGVVSTVHTVPRFICIYLLVSDFYSDYKAISLSTIG